MELETNHDVDVVPHARAVVRRVVVAEHFELRRQLADRDLAEEREEVARLAHRVFADEAGWVGACGAMLVNYSSMKGRESAKIRTGGVKVAKAQGPPFIRGRVADVLDDELAHHLRPAVCFSM